MKRSTWLALGAAAVVILISADAYAAFDPNNVLDKIVTTYHDKASGWESTLKSSATSLFWILAAIEFTWAAARLAVKGADMSEWVAEVVNQIMVIGLFLALMNHSAEWAQDIVDSFRTAGNNASVAAGGSSNMAPSNIFDIGVQVASKIMEKTSVWSPADSIGLLISALVIVVCFGLIAAFMILVLVESYVVIYAGVLMMGFGASRFTREFTISFFKYSISVGVKLFVMQLLVGLGEALIKDWLQNFDNTKVTDIFVMVGASIVMLALTKMIPDLVQGLVNGVSMSAASAITGAAGAVGSAVGNAAVNAFGSGAAAYGAGKLASDNPPSSRIGRFAEMTGRTAANLGGAALEDIGRKLSGRAPYGRSPWRMADSLKEKAETMRTKREGADRGGRGDAGNTIRPAD